MQNWEFYDTNILKNITNPHTIAVKNGFPIYDDGRHHNYPLYYGIFIVDAKIMKKMLKDGINGGFSFIGKKNKVVIVKTKEDYNKALAYDHYARAIFEKSSKATRSKSIVTSQYQELNYEDASIKSLLIKGISIKELCLVLDKNEDEMIIKCYKSLINIIG